MSRYMYVIEINLEITGRKSLAKEVLTYQTGTGITKIVEE